MPHLPLVTLGRHNAQATTRVFLEALKSAWIPRPPVGYCQLMNLHYVVDKQSSPKRIRFLDIEELLIPKNVRGLKRVANFKFYKIPWLPSFIYNDLLQV